MSKAAAGMANFNDEILVDDSIAMARSASSGPLQTSPLGAAAAALFPPNEHADNPDVVMLPVLRLRARGQVEEAIHMMPSEKKSAYLEALSKAPDLVATETDPLKFLRCCDYNVWNAAERMVAYWTERKIIFGERAFLPLILTGHGALTNDDILTLQAGYPALLPNTRSGQKALLFDRRKWTPYSTIENRLRCIFYVFHHVSELELSQTEGVHCVVLVVASKLYVVPLEFVMRCSRLAKVLPVKLIFYVAGIPSIGQPFFLQKTFSQYLETVMIMSTRASVHIEREPGQLLEELQEEGFTRAGVPTCIGGDWSVEVFFQWLKEQRAIEKERYKSLRETAVKRKMIDEKEKLEKRRRADLVHSRRKRERKRLEIVSLKEESSRLQREHDLLNSTNQKLQQLIQQAETIVGKSLESTTNLEPKSSG